MKKIIDRYHNRYIALLDSFLRNCSHIHPKSMGLLCMVLCWISYSKVTEQYRFFLDFSDIIEVLQLPPSCQQSKKNKDWKSNTSSWICRYMDELTGYEEYDKNGNFVKTHQPLLIDGLHIVDNWMISDDVVEIELNPKVLPYFSGFTEAAKAENSKSKYKVKEERKYTRIYCDAIWCLKSVHSWDLFSLLIVNAQWQYKDSYFRLYVGKVKNKFNLAWEKYTRKAKNRDTGAEMNVLDRSNFEKFCLDRSFAEIEAGGQIHIVKQEYRGRERWYFPTKEEYTRGGKVLYYLVTYQCNFNLDK